MSVFLRDTPSPLNSPAHSGDPMVSRSIQSSDTDGDEPAEGNRAATAHDPASEPLSASALLLKSFPDTDPVFESVDLDEDELANLVTSANDLEDGEFAEGEKEPSEPLSEPVSRQEDRNTDETPTSSSLSLLEETAPVQSPDSDLPANSPLTSFQDEIELEDCEVVDDGEPQEPVVPDRRVVESTCLVSQPSANPCAMGPPPIPSIDDVRTHCHNIATCEADETLKAYLTNHDARRLSIFPVNDRAARRAWTGLDPQCQHDMVQ